MGTYKVPQNVEAEDKILGPLSMKQFIYALIGIGYGGLMFVIFKSVILIWVVIGLPPMLILVGLGLYQREDQPLETYVLAVVQYFTRPKIRLWHKEPIAEIFHLEPPPPKPEMAHRDSREVRSQLQQLAELVDTRGWSVKEPELQEPNMSPVVDLSDRIGGETLVQPELVLDGSAVTDEDDILNTQTAAAQNLNVLIENSVKSVREEAMEKMRARTISAPPAATTMLSAAAIQQITGGAASSAATPPSTSEMTPAPSGDILKLATEGGDLTVTQLAAQARRTIQTLSEGQSVSIRHAEATTV